MIIINKERLDALSKVASDSPRLRTIHCFHEGPEDTLQRMLNAIEPNSYICPHRHLNPDKREIFLLVRGSGAVFTFHDDGKISEFFILDVSQGNYGVEIPIGIWHTVIALEPETVFYEFKDGPYAPINDKDFAPWAPREGESEVANYIDYLTKHLNLQS